MKSLLTLARHEKMYVQAFVDQLPFELCQLTRILVTASKLTLVFQNQGQVSLSVLDRDQIPNPFKDSEAVRVEDFVQEYSHSPSPRP